MARWFLHGLKIKDFKSFKGEHFVGPFESFSTIIGPNGSGKSNVLEAIAFVFLLDMNPRSQNYIFSSPTIDPEDNCLVTAILHKSDDSEDPVEFTRVFGRDANFYINDIECEESEYVEAVRSRGITPLSFVKQNEIDAIARKSPMELTHFFEEMSGSIKYAADYDRYKQESEAAHENVALLEKRRRAAQAERRHIHNRREEAMHFTSLAEDEAKLAVEAAVFQLYHIKRRLTAAKEDRVSLDVTRSKLSQDIDKLNDDIHTAQRASNEAHSLLATEDNKLQQTEQEARKTRAELVRLEELLAVAEEQVASTKTNLETASTSTRDRESRLREMEEELETVSKELESLPREGEEEAEVERYNSIRVQASKQFSEISEKLRAVLSDKNDAVREREDAEKMEKSDRISLDRIEAQLKAVIEETARTKERLAAIQREAETLKVDLKMKSAADEADLSRQRDFVEELKEATKQRDEIRRREGVSKKTERLVKSVKTMQQLIPGVYGRFASLIQTAGGAAGKKYANAVAAGLSGYENAVVVKDKETASRCIEFLREQGSGTVTFLPLKNLMPSTSRVPSGTVLLSQVLRCDPQYKVALDYVCGSTAVCDSLKEARKLSFSSRIPVVTIDGSYVDPSGIMTGGPLSPSQVNLETLDEIEEKRRKLETDLKLIGDRIDARRVEREQAEEKLSALEPQLRSLQGLLRELGEKTRRLEGDKRLTTKKLKEDAEIIQRLSEKVKETETAVSEVDLQQAEIDRKLFEDFCREVGVKDIREYEVTRLATFEERYSRRLRLQGRQSQLKGLIEAERRRDVSAGLELLRERLQEFITRRDELKEQVATKKAELADLADRIKEIREARERYTQDYEARQLELKQLRREAHQLSEELDQIADQYAVADHSYGAEMQALASIMQKCRLSNIQLPTVDRLSPGNGNIGLGFTQEEVDMRELESIDFKGLSAAKKATVDRAEYDAEVARYEERLAELRTEIAQIKPDLKSENRFTDVEKEIREMQEQQEELREKAKELKRKFAEVRSKRREEFMSLYNEVDAIIDSRYKLLTKLRHLDRSGTAYLNLEDTDEPYLGGVKYTAMPSHKKLRDLEQLSGGEKAVASLALVTAIQEVLGSPFVLMDEPDASLDKINLKAAALALSDLSEKSQFICVSLRDRFFAFAESLIGVYKNMDTAISGLLTLDLKEIADTTLVLEDE